MSDMPRGRPQQVTDRELIEAGRSAEGPSFTVAEVAERVEIGRQTIRGRLEKLTGEDGPLCVKKPGSDNIYWLKQAE